MQKDMITLTNISLPSVSGNAVYDIVGHTVGRYFDYKRDNSFSNFRFDCIAARNTVSFS